MLSPVKTELSSGNWLREVCLREQVLGGSPTRSEEALVVVYTKRATPAVFEVQGPVARHVGRLQSLASADFDTLIGSLVDSHDVRLVIFEDVKFVREGIQHGAFGYLEFCYKSNWRLDLEPNIGYLSEGQQRATKKKMQKLTTMLGAEPRHIFRRAVHSDIDLIERMNRSKIEGRGRRYHSTDKKKDLLKEASEQFGHASLLEHDGRVIAGCIACIVDGRAYLPLQGYDLDFHQYSSGILLQLKTLTACEALGCVEANLLWGDGRWKADLGARREKLHTLVMCPHPSDFLRLKCLRAIAPHAYGSARQRLKRALYRDAFLTRPIV